MKKRVLRHNKLIDLYNIVRMTLIFGWRKVIKEKQTQNLTNTISIDVKRSSISNILYKDYYWTILQKLTGHQNVFQNRKTL